MVVVSRGAGLVLTGDGVELVMSSAEVVVVVDVGVFGGVFGGSGAVVVVPVTPVVGVPCVVIVVDVVGTLGVLGVMTVELCTELEPEPVSSAEARPTSVVDAIMVALTISSL